MAVAGTPGEVVDVFTTVGNVSSVDVEGASIDFQVPEGAAVVGIEGGGDVGGGAEDGGSGGNPADTGAEQLPALLAAVSPLIVGEAAMAMWARRF